MSYNIMLYTDTAQSFFEVDPSGLVISSIYGSTSGSYEMAIGTNQSLTLDPVRYSYDIDSLANISALSFQFFCKVIDNGVEYSYPQIYYNDDLDLFTLLSNYSSNPSIPQFFDPNNNHTCFISTGYLSLHSAKMCHCIIF